MRRTLLVLVALSVVLVGCAEDPEPRFEPAQEPPSASETSEPDPDPEPWQKKSKAGAVAFAHHWVEVFNEAQATGDTDELRSASSRRCTSCQGYIRQLEDLYGSGGRLKSKGWKVLVAGPQPGPVNNEVEVVVRIARSPQKVVHNDGETEKFPGGKASFSAVLVWRNDRWVLNRLVRFV